MHSYDQLVVEYKDNPVYRNLRLGQYFVMSYIDKAWDELYYTEDNDLTRALITSWLKAHQYYLYLPPKVKKPMKVEFSKTVL